MSRSVVIDVTPLTGLPCSGPDSSPSKIASLDGRESTEAVLGLALAEWRLEDLT